MKAKWLIVIPLVLVLGLICVAILGTLWFAGNRMVVEGVQFPQMGAMNFSAKAEEEKAFEVKSPAGLEVTNPFGFVHVEAGSTDSQIQIKAAKTAYGISQTAAQENLDKLKVTMTQSGSTVTVSVEMQPNQTNWSGSVDFTITVPKQTEVKLKSETGDLSLTGTQGDANLDTSFGTVKAQDITGDLVVTTRNGRVDASNIQAGASNISLSSEFGDVTLEDSTGSAVTVGSNNGGLTLTQVKASGKADLHSEFGRITFKGGSASELLVKTQNGDVVLSELQIAGPLTANTSFGGLTLTNVSAKGYELGSTNGAIKVDGASGSVKASSDFGSVEIRNATDAVLDLKSNNGTVSFEGSLGKGAQTLHSGFGSVTLRLPETSAFNFDLKTGFGKISSDFEMTIKGSPDEKHWTGKVNGGGDLVTVTTDNGNITFEASK